MTLTLPLGNPHVLMAQTEGLADPHASIQQQREQQPVPQVLTGIQDRLNLFDRKDFRTRRRRPQADRPPPLGSVSS
jgi:hypothetical protein